MTNKVKKVVLISPPLYFSGGIPNSLDTSVPPLGLLYLASYVNKFAQGIKAVILDVAAEKLSLDEVVEKVRQTETLAVGISAMTPQLQGAVELAKSLKEASKNKIKIFLGGSHVSADPDFVNRFSDFFDYAITGEAEKTFLKSLEALSRGDKLPRVQPGEIVDDLDVIPFPDRSLIHREKYRQHESMMYSRGCPYNCYYCSRPAIAKKVRYRSADNLIEEIKSVYGYCQGKIDFQDDSFTISKEKVLEFCHQVEENHLALEWACNTRIDLVDQELLTAMSQAGCKLIHFGIEAGNESVRRDIVNKGNFTNREIQTVFNLCRENKIKVGGYFMVGHPGEIKKDLKETYDLIRASKIDILGLSLPIPFPGSKLYKIAEVRGIVSQTIIDKFALKELGEGYAGVYPVLISEKLEESFVYGIMKKINREFYLNLKTFWQRLKEDLFSWKRIKEDAKDLISLFRKGMSTRKPYVTDKKILSKKGKT